LQPTNDDALEAGSSNFDLPAPIKNVNVFLSLENCEKFIEKENHQARIAQLRKEGLSYIQSTNFLFDK
jgi:hypothetical protein